MAKTLQKYYLEAARCTVWLDFDLPVGLSPMADSDNVNDPLSVIDAVNNPVVSNSEYATGSVRPAAYETRKAVGLGRDRRS